jgi:hypothetical protein
LLLLIQCEANGSIVQQLLQQKATGNLTIDHFKELSR